jgi:hypothetical protein
MADQEDPTQIVHARIELATGQDGGIGMTLHVIPDPTNPSVHFAQWLYDNRQELSAMAKREFDLKAQQAGRVIENARPALRGPDGGRLS